MKYPFPYKEGDTLMIYDDWENELLPLGTATLIEQVSVGRSFILSEIMPESSQIVYNYETWLVDLNGTKQKRKIRFVDTIGIANSADDEINDEIDKLFKDSFLEINGIQIY